MNQQFSCIIPFYNEGENLLSIIKIFSTIPPIKQIICVDDGSVNNLSQLVKKRYPNIILIKHPQNQGKSQAVFSGLTEASYENIILFDSDCQFVKKQEIIAALNRFSSTSSDMVVLKTRGLNMFIDRTLIFLSGNRIVKKKDLVLIEKSKPKRYQLEVAINSYMLKNKKKICWMDSSIYNPHKVTKVGLLKGIKREIQMEIDIFTFVGLREYLKQLISLSKKDLKTS